jgi:predicted RNase H-like nuclease (RuvC/YqgF family)
MARGQGSPNGAPGDVRQTVVAARAQLDDLLAELEAGTRFVTRIERDFAGLENPMTGNQRGREEMRHLTEQLCELRGSLRQQRMLMTQLRQCFDTLRRQLDGVHR